MRFLKWFGVIFTGLVLAGCQPKSDGTSANEKTVRDGVIQPSATGGATSENGPEIRYALLIGNEDYPDVVGELKNPHEDIATVYNALISAGFDDDNIEMVQDATRDEISIAVDAFASKLRAAGDRGVGFFYYSGHGGSAEKSGQRHNYILPAKTAIDTSEKLKLQGVPLSDVHDALATTGAKATFVFWDACRNSLPITSQKGGDQDKGFTREERRTGLYIGFATADDRTTPDDGLFARLIAEELPAMNRRHYETTRKIMARLAEKRPSDKSPFDIDGVRSDAFCFNGCPGIDPFVLPSLSALSNDEYKSWAAAAKSIDAPAFRSYLSTHPNGKLAPAARWAVSASEAIAAIEKLRPSAETGQVARSDFSKYDTMNDVLYLTAKKLVNEQAGKGYSLTGRYTETFTYGNEALEPTEGGKTSLVAFVDEVLIRSIDEWSKQNNSSTAYSKMTAQQLSGSGASLRRWIYMYDLGAPIPSLGRSFGRGIGDGFLIYGMGRYVAFEDAEAGDFIYHTRRASGSGRAGIFAHYVNSEFAPVEQYGPSVAGFKLYTASSSANGVAEVYAFFGDECPAPVIGIRRDCDIVREGEAGPYVSRLHDPSTWKTHDADTVTKLVMESGMNFKELQTLQYPAGDADD